MKNAFLFIVSLLFLNTGFSQYCTPYYASASASCFTWGMGISEFVLGGVSSSAIDDFSTCTGLGYENKTGLSVNLQQGSSYYTLIYTAGSTYTMNCQVWIDFNNDNIFETSESVGGLNNYLSGGFNIVIPSSANTGSHRMRIVTSWSGDGIYYPSLDPCTSGYSCGDARDYTVFIESGNCSGTPIAGTISPTIITSCNPLSVTFTSLGSSSEIGNSYQWQSSPDHVTWTNISGGTGTALDIWVWTSTYFRLQVSCLYSSLSAYSSSSFVDILLPEVYITGLNKVCKGSQIILGSSPIGGTWSSSNSSIASVGLDTGIVTGLDTGVTTISYSFTNSCGTVVVTDSVNVNPLPSEIITSGIPSICTGSTIVLTDSTNDGIWSSSDTSIATVNSFTGIVTGVSNGYAPINYTIYPTNCSIPITITVNTSPSAISGLINVCRGSYISLVSSPAGGTWSSSNASIASVATTGIVTGVSTGTTSISYSISDGCYQGTLIIVNSLPNPLISYSVYGPCLFVNSYYSCQWFLNGNAISGATNNILFPTSPGIYTIEVIDSNWCSATSSPFVFIPEAIISCNLSENDINIFPNPASSVITFETKMPINISIISIAGKIILDQKNVSSVNIENLSEGLYIIRISDENGTFIKNEKLSVLRR